MPLKMKLAFQVYIVALTAIVSSFTATCNEYNLDSAEDEYTADLAIQHGNDVANPRPVDCAEILQNGQKYSGVYTIYPRHRIIPCGTLKVYCDMYSDGGGWTVIQRRGNFKRSPDYFYKTWKEYKTGFGNIKEDFWIGNDNIYAITNQKRYSVRFDLGTDKSQNAYAIYDKFWIENEELKYRLYISDYSGTAGDSMGYHHNMTFSTKDHKTTTASDCAKERMGGWWYYNCAQANLNGLYLRGSYNENMLNGTTWMTWKGYNVSLESVEIKIRPYDFNLQ